MYQIVILDSGAAEVVGKVVQSFNVMNDKNPACPGYNVGSLILLP
jgi:hypothetical protein